MQGLFASLTEVTIDNYKKFRPLIIIEKEELKVLEDEDIVSLCRFFATLEGWSDREYSRHCSEAGPKVATPSSLSDYIKPTYEIGHEIFEKLHHISKAHAEDELTDSELVEYFGLGEFNPTTMKWLPLGNNTIELVSIVNRFDLMPKTFTNCGELRFIFRVDANGGGNVVLKHSDASIIFEPKIIYKILSPIPDDIDELRESVCFKFHELWNSFLGDNHFIISEESEKQTEFFRILWSFLYEGRELKIGETVFAFEPLISAKSLGAAFQGGQIRLSSYTSTKNSLWGFEQLEFLPECEKSGGKTTKCMRSDVITNVINQRYLTAYVESSEDTSEFEKCMKSERGFLDQIFEYDTRMFSQKSAVNRDLFFRNINYSLPEKFSATRDILSVRFNDIVVKSENDFRDAIMLQRADGLAKSALHRAVDSWVEGKKSIKNYPYENNYDELYQHVHSRLLFNTCVGCHVTPRVDKAYGENLRELGFIKPSKKDKPINQFASIMEKSKAVHVALAIDEDNQSDISINLSEAMRKNLLPYRKQLWDDFMDNMTFPELETYNVREDCVDLKREVFVSNQDESVPKKIGYSNFARFIDEIKDKDKQTLISIANTSFLDMDANQLSNTLEEFGLDEFQLSVRLAEKKYVEKFDYKNDEKFEFKNFNELLTNYESNSTAPSAQTLEKFIRDISKEVIRP